MRNDQLSAVILTYNEEENIQRVLNSLTWLQKVYVIDSESSDKTRKLATSFSNVIFYSRKFDNHAAQWNYGLSLVDTPWVLTLDADHVLDKDWQEKWEKCDGEKKGYLVRFNYVVNERILRSSLYPPKIVLFRKDFGRFIQGGHTQRLILDGDVGSFPAKILHDDRKSMNRWFGNQIRYAELEAKKIFSCSELSLTDRFRRSCWLMPILVIPYCLFRCGLILDGRRGWIYTLQRLAAETLIALMILEKKTNDKKKCQHSRN